ncbi:MAG: hypothetical protein COX62_06805 [Deltaproteobacteria bacterium CG_4_10_14_0_2_um_filter_43_8]|nr:MAG: hypothetical protein COV43_06595 [Deltaproteobacteria bacterium CG11_big_fil_rev_8_21_14_0_20_42_23]PJA19415.1 MAG: hypothetical protein COX62_06805 [Deltaproteobacteria bacterium CG_4_10_14_0_2_um_filter_43_8]PJC63993.1 MAG: hypothetical protein CO021_06570 [Deltaproteobacteria bacterium CG_4_9_14_0_2_um_filter_42_21]
MFTVSPFSASNLARPLALTAATFAGGAALGGCDSTVEAPVHGRRYPTDAFLADAAPSNNLDMGTTRPDAGARRFDRGVRDFAVARDAFADVLPGADAFFASDATSAIDATPPADAGLPALPEAPVYLHLANLTSDFVDSLSGQVNADDSTSFYFTSNSILYRITLDPAGNLQMQNGNAYEQVAAFPGSAAQNIILPDGNVTVSHSTPDGITIIGANGTVQTLDYSQHVGNGLGFVPNLPAGLALFGGVLCANNNNIAAPNFNDPALTSFYSAALVCAPYAAGTLDINGTFVWPLDGVNGTALITDPITGELAALTSNGYDPDAATARLHFTALDAADETTFFELGHLTGQVAPTFPFSGVEAVVGIQAPEIGVSAISLADGSSRFVALPQVAGFPASINRAGNWALVSAFGIFGEPSNVVALNLDNPDQTLLSELPGNAGPSILLGGKHYQVVTTPDGNLLVAANVSALQ